MKKNALYIKLEELRKKQEQIEAASKKRSGNTELLQFLVEIMPKALNAERCSIFIHDPVQQDVWLQCGTGLGEKEVSVPESGSLVGRVISSGNVIIENDMQSVVGTHDIIAMQTGFICRNSMCVPVRGVTTQRVTGAIQLLNKSHGKKFNNQDQQYLEKLAFLLQMNIENIFLRQELSRLSNQLKNKIEKLEQQLKPKKRHQ
ncbi:MAG: GAF domain-containing protein [Gammaproteobacteria bacterium]|nr:GAF domain-containing protein [Gammaproteobacteria bacterium]